MAKEREEAAAIRDDRGHGGRKSDCSPTEHRPRVQGVEWKDNEPAHESQGQGQMDWGKKNGLPSAERGKCFAAFCVSLRRSSPCSPMLNPGLALIRKQGKTESCH